MLYDVASVSDRGGRPNNEDSLYVAQQNGLLTAIVADGCGGHSDGEVASAAVCAAFSDAVADWTADSLTEEKVSALLAAGDAAVRRHPKAGGGMRSTASLLVASGDRAITAHVGDTRVYCLRGGDVRYQSTDHSVSQLAVLSGEITLPEIRAHADRNKLLFAVGGGMPTRISAEAIRLQPGDGLLICTDGFWEYVLESDMAPAETAEKWLSRMLSAREARAPKTCDNYTAITIICKEDVPCV